MIRVGYFWLFPALTAFAEAGPITYNNLPLGTAGKPLLLRTYVPDPGLDAAVFEAGRIYQINLPEMKSKDGDSIRNRLVFYTANRLPNAAGSVPHDRH